MEHKQILRKGKRKLEIKTNKHSEHCNQRIPDLQSLVIPDKRTRG